MGVTAVHPADDEANVLRQMSLRPLNAELSSGTSRLLVRELQGRATLCLWVSVDVGSLDMLRYIIVKWEVYLWRARGNFKAKIKIETNMSREGKEMCILAGMRMEKEHLSNELQRSNPRKSNHQNMLA